MSDLNEDLKLVIIQKESAYLLESVLKVFEDPNSHFSLQIIIVIQLLLALKRDLILNFELATSNVMNVGAEIYKAIRPT